jgi:hypothetical protein
MEPAMADEAVKTRDKNSFEKAAEKHDETTRAALSIIAQQNAERDAKTAKLRAARLARDQNAMKRPK